MRCDFISGYKCDQGSRRHKNKENMDGTKLYESAPKKMLTFTVPRLYKQREKTQSRGQRR